MTKKIRHGDPRNAQFNAARRDHFRRLAQEALLAEGIQNQEIIEGLTEAAYQAGYGLHPSIYPPESNTQLKRSFEALQAEGKGLQRRLDDLAETINAASLDVHIAINDALKKRGLDAATLNAAMEAMATAAKEIAAIPMPACAKLVEQGRNPDPLHAWLSVVWPYLKPHLSMKAAGRVCSKVFTGDSRKAATLYQAIRNASR